MRRTIVSLVLWGPITACAATHTLGIDIGRASTADMRCPAAEAGRCSLQDDAQRIYYEFHPGEALGFRATILNLNDLRITTDSDPVFNLPGIQSSIQDLSLTYSYPLWKKLAIGGRVGLGYWEESRSAGAYFSQASSNGLSPVLGVNLDFGSGRLRAGLSADLYPAVGDTGHVRYYGAGLRIVFGKLTKSR
jgi:hypothetical protein